MPKNLKRNAVIVCGLAALFYWSFMFAKHDPGLRSVIPFGEDPYDAVGSFGVVVGMIIALISLVRAFRPYHQSPPSTAQRVYLVRSQAAVVLGVLITLAADTVAMVRHPHMWIGAASRNVLVALIGGLAAATVAVQLLICASQRELPEPGSKRGKRAGIASLLAILILVLYPEQLINRTPTHLLTIVAGAFLLFAPMRLLLTALVPYKAEEAPTEMPAHSRFSSLKHRWGIVLLGGVLLGAFTLAGEMTEGGGAPPLRRLMFVASVFISLWIAGFSIAYVFLGEPLGFGPRGCAEPKTRVRA
jgi:hypothetical protein